MYKIHEREREAVQLVREVKISRYILLNAYEHFGLVQLVFLVGLPRMSRQRSLKHDNLDGLIVFVAKNVLLYNFNAYS